MDSPARPYLATQLASLHHCALIRSLELDLVVVLKLLAEGICRLAIVALGSRQGTGHLCVEE